MTSSTKSPNDARKKYTASTAQIVADRGNRMEADIMETGEMYTDMVDNIRQQMRKDYWALHGQIANHSFTPGSSQTDAVAKLGQLGLALQAVEKAYSKCSTVRCF